MKKVLIAVLTLTMLLTVSVGAMAETFTLSVPCQAIADNQLYKYHATAFSMFQKPIERSACTPIKERSRTVLFFSLDIHTPTVTYRL
mgnify:CR=1 FL=1